MTAVRSYTEQERSQAKALALAFGNAEEAKRALASYWEGSTPTSQAIRLWVKDPSVLPDTEFFQQFSAEQKRRVLGSISRLLSPLETRVLTEQANGSSLELLNATKAWGIMVDKLRPDTTPGYVHNVTHIGSVEVRDPMMLFGPRAEVVEPKPVIEGEIVE